MNGVSSAVTRPSQTTASRLTTTNDSSNLAWSGSPSESPNSLNHGLQVHLHSRSITATKCISKLARLKPPSLQHHGLQVHLHTRTIVASKCITNLARSLPSTVHPNSHDYGLLVRWNTAYKCIIEVTRSWRWSASLSSHDQDAVNRWSWKADSPWSTVRCISHGFLRDFLWQSSSGLRNSGRGGEDKQGYPTMMKHTKWVDLWNRGKTAWGSTQIVWMYENSARVCEEPQKLCGTIKPQQECMRPRSGNDRVCIILLPLVHMVRLTLQKIVNHGTCKVPCKH